MRKRKPSTLTSECFMGTTHAVKLNSVASVNTEKTKVSIEPARDKALLTNIRVTQKDIDDSRGFQTNSSKCPIARAITRTFKTDYVSVGPRLTCFSDNVYRLPVEAQKFVGKFDTNQVVTPFSFKLEQI